MPRRPVDALNGYRRRWARNIQAARRARNLTQSQLGRLLDIDQQNISRWERGRSIPRDDMKHKLAVFFDMPIGDLFPWDDQANGDDQAVA